MKILGTICARGGSKGIKDKNIRDLAGYPLIAYTIDVMKQWAKADRIVVSTDSDKIATVARNYGAEVPFMRPAYLATDEAPKIPVLQHIVDFCEQQEGSKYDIIVDLQPTSPLRKPADVGNALKKFIDTKADVLYSVNESTKNPYFTMVELDSNGNARLSKILEKEIFRRQDIPKVYTINGSIYFFNRDFLMSTNSLHCENEKIFIMDETSSVDIDTELDFKFVEFLLKSKYFEYSFSQNHH